jgi:hypothetical protein
MIKFRIIYVFSKEEHKTSHAEAEVTNKEHECINREYGCSIGKRSVKNPANIVTYLPTVFTSHNAVCNVSKINKTH